MKKIVLITGATSGIGEACARRFAEGGYNLILTARRAERLADIKAELEARGADSLTGEPVKVKTLAFDVRDTQAAKAAIDSCGLKSVEVYVGGSGSWGRCLNRGILPRQSTIRPWQKRSG